jgi:hypothetical protein
VLSLDSGGSDLKAMRIYITGCTSVHFTLGKAALGAI